MPSAPANGWDRRDFIGGATLLALAIGVPTAGAALSRLAGDDVPSADQRLLLREVSQLVLPRTGTPGAGELDVGDFVLLGLAHGLEGARKPMGAAADPGLSQWRRADSSLRHADWLEAELNHRAGGDFMAQSPAQRAAMLASLDGQAFAQGADDHPWRVVKALILFGYYTTEIGGSRELRYEAVPGRWDSDLPLAPQDRAFSSDWTAVDFG